MYETSYKIPEPTTRNVNTDLRLKVFSAHEPGIVEQMVNQWLSTQNVSVRHTGQSQSEKSGRFVFTISLFYSA
jgi:hypothetical protein